jgi:hypothetical protein
MLVFNENERYDNIIHFEHEQNIFTRTGYDLRVILSCSLEWDKNWHKINISHASVLLLFCPFLLPDCHYICLDVFLYN